jgi:Tfp pilus assembly protein PilN
MEGAPEKETKPPKIKKQKKIKPKEMNFYERFNYDPEAEEAKIARRKALIPLCALLGVVLLVFLTLTGMTLYKNHKTNVYKEYMSNTDNQLQYQEANQIKKDKDKKVATYSGLQDFKTRSEAYPDASSAVMTEVEACLGNGKVTAFTFSSEQRTLMVSVSTSSASSVASMVKQIKKIAAFESVTYTGYEGNGKQYSATITCTYNK